MSGTDNSTIVLTPDTFRQLLRAFADTERYSNLAVQFYLNQAATSLTPTVWQDQLTMGTLYYVAHYLTLDDETARGAGASGNPGPITSKSGGGVSVSRDTNVAAEDLAGHYNQTSWGRRFYHLVQLVGMGGAQLGGAPLPGASGLYPGNWFPGSAFAYGDELDP